jgi:SH3 domain-containing YSC84-like protein 1
MIAKAAQPESKGDQMKKVIATLVALALVGLPLATAVAETKEHARLENCGAVLADIVNIPDDIPQVLIDKAECVIVIPSVFKAAFIVGGSYGRGAMVCRTGGTWTGPWGAPVMMTLEGGSFGFQLGAQATDFIILVMNPRGANAILKNKVKLGADASVAAGPKGRTASADTDVTLRAEMLTYSRARGLFAGVSLSGASLRPDDAANEELYDKKIDPVELVRAPEGTPPSAQKMIDVLTRLSPRNLSDPASLR